MSHPFVNIYKNWFKKNLILFHKKVEHSARLNYLSKKVIPLINGIDFKYDNIQCLGVDCGDMVIAELVSSNIPGVEYICVDIHEIPDHLKNTKKYEKYRVYGGCNLPFKDDFFDM
jgi:hypothetical protein